MLDSKIKCKQILLTGNNTSCSTTAVFTTFTDAAADILWPVAYF